jgi:hypothetical protein
MDYQDPENNKTRKIKTISWLPHFLDSTYINIYRRE